MKQYLALLQEIRDYGVSKDDRTWTGTRSIFGMQAKYNLQDGFPLVTTKKTFLRGIIVELIWITRGETNIKYLVDRDVHIRDERPFQNYLKIIWKDKDFLMYSEAWLEEKKSFIEKIKRLPIDDDFIVTYGELWPVYGHQRRNFNSQWIDQLAEAVKNIQQNPTSRRIIVSARNPAQIWQMLLPPCHTFFQFDVNTKDGLLNLLLYQRSCDMFLGVPFNIASYAALLLLIAKITWLQPWTFTHTLWDAHIYNNHIEQVDLQLSREPFPLPELKILKDIHTLEDIEQLEWSDFEFVNYQCYEAIKAPVAV